MSLAHAIGRVMIAIGMGLARMPGRRRPSPGAGRVRGCSHMGILQRPQCESLLEASLYLQMSA